MKGQKLQKRKVLLFWILLFLFPVSVNAAEQEEAFLEDLELQQMQEAVNFAVSSCLGQGNLCADYFAGSGCRLVF